MRWIRELERRGHRFCRYADDCNIYVGSQAAAERTLASIQGWIEKHLRLKVNAAKSGTGRVWERKFLGFRLDRKRRIGVAPESMERFKAKVREMWRGSQSRTSNQLRDDWSRYLRGWWGYFRLAEARQPIFRLEGWIRRHIRKCFWLTVAQRRRPGANALRRLGRTCPSAANRAHQSRRLVHGPHIDHERAGCGCGRYVVTASSCHRTLRRDNAAGFNRRMRKTARPVVWEGGGAQSPPLDLI